MLRQQPDDKLPPGNRVAEYIYLVWSLITTGYWLVLYENLPVPAVVPFGFATGMLLLYAWGMLKDRSALQKISLLLSIAATVVFSLLAWRLTPICDCYRFSPADLVPDAIFISMAILVLLLLRQAERSDLL
jgi:hypothetical protein